MLPEARGVTKCKGSVLADAANGSQAKLRLIFLENSTDILPDHPVPVQVNCALSTIERACSVVSNINANAACPVLNKPVCQTAKQF
jgi:hypothetical protein